MSRSVDRFQFLNERVPLNVARGIPSTRVASAENIATTIRVRVRLPSRSESSRQLHSSHALVGACPVVHEIFESGRRCILTRPGSLDRSFVERARHLERRSSANCSRTIHRRQAIAPPPETAPLEYSSARCLTEEISATGRTSTIEP